MENKNAKDDPKIEVKVTAVSETVKFPAVKRMLESLDKFLSRKIASVVGFYIFAMLVCSVVLVSTTVSASEVEGGVTGGVKTADIWMYSLLATFTFIFVLLVVRYFAVRKTLKRK